MNRDLAGPETVDEKRLDLLVDGELDAAGRRELLRELDATPGGWRQCALAFLEAQAWRLDLRAAPDQPNGRIARPFGAVSEDRRLAHRLRHWSLLAASVVCAFAAGWTTRSKPAPPGAPDAVAVAPKPADQRQVTASAVAADTNVAGPSEPDANETTPVAEKLPAGVQVTGILTLKFDDHGHEREMQLPVIDAAGIDLRQWLEQPSAFNAAAVQALERRGHKVESQRQLVTVNLKDGRKLLLPVDQVDVRFAHRVYQ